MGAANEPIDPRVRLVISQWPQDAPRGAVSTFCAEHGISRKSFYELRLQAQVDAFDHIYNTERPHQGLPGRRTPQAAWEATEKAEAPRPKPDPHFFVQSVAKRLRPAPMPTDLPAGTHVKKLTSAGTFMLARVNYMVGGQYGFQRAWSSPTATRSPSPTWTARSSSSTPDPPQE